MRVWSLEEGVRMLWGKVRLLVGSRSVRNLAKHLQRGRGTCPGYMACLYQDMSLSYKDLVHPGTQWVFLNFEVYVYV